MSDHEAGESTAVTAPVSDNWLLARAMRIVRYMADMRRVGMLGEILLLIVVAAFFAYFLVNSFTAWPRGSALVPRIVVGVGIPFWVIRVGVLLLRKEESRGTIMDIGLSIGKDPRAEGLRLLRIGTAFALLIFAIWFVGFHIAIPVWVFAYLVRYGHLRWYWALAWATGFEAFIYGIFDFLITTAWPTPELFSLLGKSYFFGIN